MKKLKTILEFIFRMYGIYVLKIKDEKDLFQQITINLNELKSQFRFKILNKNDISYFLKLNLDKKYIDIYLQRLNSLDFICFSVVDDHTDELVYYSWINFSENYFCKEVNKSFSFKETNSCLFEDDNTIEKYRNLGIHKYIMKKRIEYCLNKNIKKIFILIHLRNVPAIKTVKKFNFKRTFDIPITIRKEAFIYIKNKFL